MPASVPSNRLSFRESTSSHDRADYLPHTLKTTLLPIRRLITRRKLNILLISLEQETNLERWRSETRDIILRVKRNTTLCVTAEFCASIDVLFEFALEINRRRVKVASVDFLSADFVGGVRGDGSPAGAGNGGGGCGSYVG